jgi:molybdate transport system substrate-binding protein
MSKALVFVAIVASSVLTISPGAGSIAQVRVLSAVGMRQVLADLVPNFERIIGHSVHLNFDSGATIVRRIGAGEAADVVFLPNEAAAQLAAGRKVVPDSISEIASSRVGVAVRSDAPRPDISSPAALRRTLLTARAVARPDPAQGGSSGLHIQEMLERLGIEDTITATSILSSHPDREDEMPAVRLARGEADIALHQMQELSSVSGVVVIGPLPGDLDVEFRFSAALVNGSSHHQPGRALIAYLLTPQAKAAINAKGMRASAPLK